MIGKTFGRYQVVAELGEGGTGEVFLAHDTRLHRRVALSCSLRRSDPIESDHCTGGAGRLGAHPPQCRGRVQRRRVRRSRLHRDGTCRGTIPGRASARRAAVGARRRLHRQPNRGSTAAAHAIGIIHRDVKPADVMITPAAQVKVLDFGLAKLAGDSGAQDDTRAWMTGPHVVMGTAAYMSPEQSIGARVDHRTDVFFSASCCMRRLRGGCRSAALLPSR